MKNCYQNKNIPEIETVAEHKYIQPPPPTILCVDCNEPVYFYEYEEGKEAVCLWCQIKREELAAFK
jgi:hypothetical protein